MKETRRIEQQDNALTFKSRQHAKQTFSQLPKFQIMSIYSNKRGI